MATLAKVPNYIWDLIASIFQGAVTRNKKLKSQATPTSLTHFTSMGKIPTADLKVWLERVVKGEWNTKHFSDRCNLYKKSIRVKHDILEFVQSVRSEQKFESYEKIVQSYPQLGDKAWFSNVVQWVPQSVKAKLSPHIKDMIIKILDEADKEEDEPDEVLYVIYISIYTYYFILLNLVNIIRIFLHEIFHQKNLDNNNQIFTSQYNYYLGGSNNQSIF